MSDYISEFLVRCDTAMADPNISLEGSTKALVHITTSCDESGWVGLYARMADGTLLDYEHFNGNPNFGSEHDQFFRNFVEVTHSRIKLALIEAFKPQVG